MISSVSSGASYSYTPSTSTAATRTGACCSAAPNCDCGKSAGKTGATAQTPQSTTVGAQTDPAKVAEQRMVDALEARDREVRQHEMAHMAAGAGVVTGGPSYSFQTGPDGKSYAIGGEVPIDVSPGKTPEETIEKARTIRAAALAPSDPSGADLSIAARASQMEMAARLELNNKAKDPENPESGKAALSLKIDDALNPRLGSLLAVA